MNLDNKIKRLAEECAARDPKTMCKDCTQGYTVEKGIAAAHPDHISLCHLHAAAPELLQACRMALNLPNVGPMETSAIIESIAVAIAKAEGR